MSEIDRALSTAVTHSLTLAITTVLISGLLIGAGNVLDSQEQRAAQAQFNEIGGDLTAQLNTLDRLNETGDQVTVTVEPEYPALIAGQSWNLRIISSADSQQFSRYQNVPSVIQIESRHHDRLIEYPLNNQTEIEYGQAASSDEPTLSLCSDGVIRFGECP
jgi:hypothetical protein